MDEDQDLMLARVLQQQETALYALMAGAGRSGSGTSSGGASSADEDEALARQLQAEEHEAAAQLGGLDVDALSYEACTALGEMAGVVSKGLPAHAARRLLRRTASEHLRQLCSCQGQAGGCSGACGAASSMCVVCQLTFSEAREPVKLLPGCAHAFHGGCLDAWLQRSKACPLCGAEVDSAAEGGGE